MGSRRKGDHADAGNLTRDELSTSGAATAHFTHRGYTGHQHLDGLGLVHMNGRIYDPVIGRFLQADPIVQEPFNGQNFNRYTYVLNNPLAYTDPTGYSFWTEVRRPVAAIAAAFLTYGQSMAYLSGGTQFIWTAEAYAGFQAVSAAAAGFAAGSISGGNIESAILGAFTGGALSTIGAAGLPWFEKAMAHAVIGCIGAGVNGDCGRSALAGGFSSLAGSALSMHGLQGWDNMATRSVIGGLSSTAAGGKFANGAFTAAFNYLLNDFAHETGDPNAQPICTTCSRISEPMPDWLASTFEFAMDFSGYNAAMATIDGIVNLDGTAVAGGAVGLALGKAKAAGKLGEKIVGGVRKGDAVVVKGGREEAKRLFRENAEKKGRKLERDKTGGSRGVAGKTSDGTDIRIRFKPDGTTRIQAGDQKFIFPKE